MSSTPAVPWLVERVVTEGSFSQSSYTISLSKFVWQRCGCYLYVDYYSSAVYFFHAELKIIFRKADIIFKYTLQLSFGRDELLKYMPPTQLLREKNGIDTSHVVIYKCVRWHGSELEAISFLEESCGLCLMPSWFDLYFKKMNSSEF